MPTAVKKAMLLAAGRGTRMRELTNELPKPMVAVRGKPILEHIITGLVRAGIEEMLIVVGWQKHVIMDHFGDGSAFGVRISYVTQEVQDGTGRVVELGKAFAGDDPFILSYGDILITPGNYPGLARLDDEEEAILSVNFGKDVSKGAAVFFNERHELVGIIEKPGPDAPVSPWNNAGVYTFRPSIFEHTAKLQLSPRGEYELPDAIIGLVQSGKLVRVFEVKGDWADVRDPEILAELNQ